MNQMQHKVTAIAIFAMCLLSLPAHAEESKFEIGLRANVLLGDGIPANDILGVGVIGRYRLYNQTNRGFDWFWTLGVGYSLANVEDVSGPTDTGGTFDLTFDVSNEIHLMATLGSSFNFSESWSASFAARLEHHFMDVLVTDRVTGETAKIDSQSPVGAYLSLNYRF
jgi:hypothetical protein